MKDTKLSELKVDDRCRVLKLLSSSLIKKRLLEMGFVRGAEIYLKKVAPLGDPMELVIMGYHVSLRRDEARDICVEKL